MISDIEPVKSELASEERVRWLRQGKANPLVANKADNE
jgi:hypothetical protein